MTTGKTIVTRKATATRAATEATISQIVEQHPCSRHALFSALETELLSVTAAGNLLANYDAHASVLRRLLLRAATIMPEPAVGFILENVRNEYGNGAYCKNHQAQLRDLALKVGVSPEHFKAFRPEAGVRTFIKQASQHYFPRSGNYPQSLYRPAIAAGAITATELLAIKEFVFLQKAFTRMGQKHHIWFHHVAIEEEHSDESLALALYFDESNSALDSVLYGLKGVLDANLHLYDGLLRTLHD
ncbi:MAG: iron-containing redox enzyme family protein [Candidatus Obscuribacterales bacterium]|nr:iron-containing redox enzyme family protein [Candidatus Obscuribacterales bacterium]